MKGGDKMNTITNGVARGLMGSMVNVKLANVAMGVYKKAENSGDEETMQRALGYASDSLNSAQKSMDQTQKAQLEASNEAKNEKDIDSAKQTSDNNNTVNKPDSSADTVQISSEGKAELNSITQTESTQDSAAVSTSTDKPAVYSPSGKVKYITVKQKLSVKA